ncbi:conserved hypothetical protein [Culex quinquefasciatus]|uniref:C2H2-type domain-containing protein n=1 Tax=Culex quinquefasciatus TaxID=7176 RepID=B0XC58_CULQU|nr:conserved hypothetical protein [Culex quinquefasciatus]|eukprot:XP_001867230.1 conserved hypothetical protein [Culex quinquefasciatus]
MRNRKRRCACLARTLKACSSVLLVLTQSKGLVCYWDLCDFRTSSATELESHVHFHAYHSRIKTYGASLNTCIDIPKCNNESRRRNHIEMYKASFRCEWGNCDERFNKVVPFFQHVNDHVRDQFPVDRKSTKEIIKCEWTHCPQQYCRRSVALEHVRRHSTERTIGCYNCGSVYTSRLKYIEHCRRQVDYQLREIPCPDCDKLFATTQLMKDHRAVHNKRYECPQCPMKWPSQKALACHIRYRHINEKPYKCHLCEHRTVSIHDLEGHLLSHKTKTEFKCPYKGCLKASKYEVTVQKHIYKDHLGYPMMVYACHMCGKSTETAASMSKHMIKVHELKREPGYNRFVYKQDTATDGKYRLRSFLKSRTVAAAEESKPDLALKKEVITEVKPLPMVADISNLERYLCPKREVNEVPEWEMAEIVPVWRTQAARKTYENKTRVLALKEF